MTHLIQINYLKPCANSQKNQYAKLQTVTELSFEQLYTLLLRTNPVLHYTL